MLEKRNKPRPQFLRFARRSAAATLIFCWLSARAQVPASLTSLGSTAPTPGPNDISQLSTNGQANKPDTLNYYTDNQSNHGAGEPGQTFKTAGAWI